MTNRLAGIIPASLFSLIDAKISPVPSDKICYNKRLMIAFATLVVLIIKQK